MILLNILDSIEWIFFWMNILDFVLNWILNWIIFKSNSMKKWIFKTYRLGLGWLELSKRKQVARHRIAVALFPGRLFDSQWFWCAFQWSQFWLKETLCAMLLKHWDLKIAGYFFLVIIHLPLSTFPLVILTTLPPISVNFPPTFDTFTPCKMTTFPFFHYIKNHNFVSLS